MQALSLEYHDVIEAGHADDSGFAGSGPASYKLTRAAFDRHLDAIGRTITQPPRQALDSLTTPAGRPLFLTFDDGGVGSIAYTADALERRGGRGHFFITAQQIGGPAFVSPAQVRQLRARGHVIGTHSYSHPLRMGGCGREEILDEWQRSTAILSDILGEAVIIGSVPGGYYRRPVAETAAQAGLKLLFTSAPTVRCWTVDGCTVAGRFTIRSWTTATTAAALAAGRLAPRAAQALVHNSLDVLRTIGGDRYTKLRQWYWARV